MNNFPCGTGAFHLASYSPKLGILAAFGAVRVIPDEFGYLCRMIQRFKTVLPLDGNNIEFDFHPMNIKDLNLFQVYCQYESERVRFHMQRDGEVFRITMQDACPAPYLPLEKMLSDAIFTNCPED